MLDFMNSTVQQKVSIVAIGNGLFARTASPKLSLMDEYRQRQVACGHGKRDPRGMCYDCGNRGGK